jgi:hypothetical protein
VFGQVRGCVSIKIFSNRTQHENRSIFNDIPNRSMYSLVVCTRTGQSNEQLSSDEHRTIVSLLSIGSTAKFNRCVTQ